MTDWTELVIAVDARDIDRAGDIAHMVSPYGFYLEDYRALEREAREIAHIDLIDEALLAKDRSIGLLHLYLAPQEHPGEAAAYLAQLLRSAGIPYEVTQRLCRSEDWANNWKAYFHPLPVGERLLIQPVWEALGDAQGRAVLWMEPGLAFGSGSHATTRLCLEAAEACLRPGAQVLDIGCGSGILAVAAVLLGAGQVLGVDIDALAVEATRENARRNHIPPETLRVAQGDLDGDVTGQYDLIFSNIVADAILLLSRSAPRFLKPDGAWIASGIIETREAEVLEAFAAAGLFVRERREEGGWLCFVCGLRGAEGCTE
jgi:ribosomal protein L11 methyltransferase